MNVGGLARRLAAPVGRPLRRAAVGLRTRDWAPHSRLFLEQEAVEWVLSYEARQLEHTAAALGIELGPSRWGRGIANQSIFHLSQFTLLLHDFRRSGNNLGLAYFHGRPGTPGMPEFDACFDAMRARHGEIDRIQVTNREMEGLVLSTGIVPEKVHRIPIGIDLGEFRPRDDAARVASRARLGLPGSAFVVGSFQKDGVGLGDGLEPKLVKGPDVLVEVLARLHSSVPELVVLLTGLARGYVRTELERREVPCRHTLLAGRDELAHAYHAVDAYVVASRQEGGPKAVLESMATGVALVTTRVGQAPELVQDGVNGFLADVDDVDGLVAALQHVYDDDDLRARVRAAGRPTAEAYADERLDDRWAELLRGFVRAG